MVSSATNRVFCLIRPTSLCVRTRLPSLSLSLSLSGHNTQQKQLQTVEPNNPNAGGVVARIVKELMKVGQSVSQSIGRQVGHASRTRTYVGTYFACLRRVGMNERTTYVFVLPCASKRCSSCIPSHHRSVHACMHRLAVRTVPSRRTNLRCTP